jgi:hypothetical protein
MDKAYLINTFFIYGVFGTLSGLFYFYILYFPPPRPVLGSARTEITYFPHLRSIQLKFDSDSDTDSRERGYRVTMDSYWVFLSFFFRIGKGGGLCGQSSSLDVTF